MITSKYTLIFVFKGNKVLMLNRLHAPVRGTWCGVGGHIEKGETSADCAKRELHEETNINPLKLVYVGEYEDISSDVYYATVSEGSYEKGFFDTQEGLLHWFTVDWILSADNEGVQKTTALALRKCLSKMASTAYNLTSYAQ